MLNENVFLHVLKSNFDTLNRIATNVDYNDLQNVPIKTIENTLTLELEYEDFFAYSDNGNIIVLDDSLNLKEGENYKLKFENQEIVSSCIKEYDGMLLIDFEVETGVDYYTKLITIMDKCYYDNDIYNKYYDENKSCIVIGWGEQQQPFQGKLQLYAAEILKLDNRYLQDTVVVNNLEIKNSPIVNNDAVTKEYSDQGILYLERSEFIRMALFSEDYLIFDLDYSEIPLNKSIDYSIVSFNADDSQYNDYIYKEVKYLVEITYESNKKYYIEKDHILSLTTSDLNRINEDIIGIRIFSNIYHLNLETVSPIVINAHLLHEATVINYLDVSFSASTEYLSIFNSNHTDSKVKRIKHIYAKPRTNQCSRVITCLTGFANLEVIDLIDVVAKFTNINDSYLNFGYAFEDLKNLKHLRQIKARTEDGIEICPSLACLFQNSKLVSIDFKGMNTWQEYHARYLFDGCNNLKRIKNLDVSNFNYLNSWDTHYMFDGCSNLKELELISDNADVIEWLLSFRIPSRPTLTIDISRNSIEVINEIMDSVNSGTTSTSCKFKTGVDD